MRSGAVEVATAGAVLVDIGTGSDAGLGGQHDPVGDMGGAARGPAAEQPLRRPTAVDGGGVNEVAVGFPVPVEDGEASSSSVSVRGPSPRGRGWTDSGSSR